LRKPGDGLSSEHYISFPGDVLPTALVVKSRVHIAVAGRVQGVSFRYFTREKAASLGLKGWVRNLRDGRVECEFEGARDALEKMVDFCREGPRLAKVTSVEIEWLQFSGEYSDFRVLV